MEREKNLSEALMNKQEMTSNETIEEKKEKKGFENREIEEDEKIFIERKSSLSIAKSCMLPTQVDNISQLKKDNVAIDTSMQQEDVIGNISVKGQKNLHNGLPDVNLEKMAMTEDLESAFNYFLKSEKKGSQNFIELRSAAIELWKYYNIQNKNHEEAQKYLEALTRCDQAASGYIFAHRSWTSHFIFSESRKKFNLAKIIREAVNTEYYKFSKQYTFSFKDEKVEPKTDQPEPEETLSQRSKMTRWYWSVIKLSELKENYRFLIKEVDNNLIDSPEEKIQKKLAYFRIYKQDFHNFQHAKIGKIEEGNKDLWEAYREDLQMKNNLTNTSFDFNEIFLEYEKLLLQEKFTKSAKENKVDQNKKSFFQSDAFKACMKKMHDDDLTDEEHQTTNQKLDKKIDETLRPEQLRGIEEIDRWVLRNIHNGGILGTVFHSLKADNTGIALELMSMTKRERLNIYYLVETRKRKTPSSQDPMTSQLSYIPNIDKFKEQMLAHKLLVVKHLTSSYVYWDKIGEAIRITRKQQSLIKMCGKSPEELDEVINAEKRALAKVQEQKEEEAEDIGHVSSEIHRNEEEEEQVIQKDDEKVNRILHYSFNCMLRINDLARKRNAIDKNQADYQEKVEEFNKHINDLKDIIIDNKNKLSDFEKKYTTVYRNTVNDKGGVSANDAMSHAGYALAGVKFAYMAQKLSTTCEMLTKVTDTVTIGGHIAGGLLTAFGSIMNFSLNVKDMSGDEVVTGLLQLLTGLSNSVLDGYSVYGIIKEGAMQFSNVPGSTFQVIGIVAGGLKILEGTSQVIGGMVQSSRVSDAQKLISERKQKEGQPKEEFNKEQRFANGMTKLEKLLADRKKGQGVAGGISGVLSLIGPITAIATGGFLIPCIGMASVISDIIATVIDSSKVEAIQTASFDQFYEIESVFKVAEAHLKEQRTREGIDEPLTAADIQTLHDQVRLHVAREFGYSTISDANSHIAGVYADHIKEMLERNKNDKESQDFKIYEGLTRGLGLKVDLPDKPTIEALSRKLAGR